MDTVTLKDGIYVLSMITFEKNDIKHKLENSIPPIQISDTNQTHVKQY